MPARLLAAACSHAVLVALGALGVLGAVLPGLAGWDTVAISSGSMQPSLQVGDIVVLDDSVEPAPGLVATFHQPGHESQLVTHRLSAPVEDGWSTRGDANDGADPWLVRSHDLVGFGRLVVPMIGLPMVWASTGQPGLAAVAAGVVALLSWSATGLRRARGGRHLRPTLAVRIERIGHALLRAAAVILLVVAAIAGRPASALFVGDTSAASSASAATVAAPVGVTSTPSCVVLVLAGRITVAWTAVAGATGYEVQGRTGGGAYSVVATVGAGTTSWVRTGTTFGQSYTHRIVTLRGTWRSPTSATTTATGPLCL